jgi:Flp pilus assembly protein TadD
MKKSIKLLSALIIIFTSIFTSCKNEEQTQPYAGSRSCRECHEKFYQLWAPSYHGTAMQGVDSTFIADQLVLNSSEVEIQGFFFKPILRNDSLIMIERKGESLKEYPAIHVLGGKYIYYFLTPFEKGRLQVLPLAYDVKEHSWYNTPASAVRHFVDPLEDQELDWHSFAYTFNTSCHSCHVSQLENNYDPRSDEYHTTWLEPGINCETCHGPSQEHVEVCRKAKDGEVPEDLKIIITSKFTNEQHNSSCAPCHAKMRTLSTEYMPGEKFFNHFDLVTLEDPDFYPDGRDLGENYTFTLWKLSGCDQSGTIHCVMCHTSSGRYRFKNENHNAACMPCHKENVNNMAGHTHHPEVEGLYCISCHMPMTEFARMERSDHSMRPPMPSATIEFGSPNACNICHDDQNAEWADKWVREWHEDDYQAETIEVGKMLLDARTGEWDKVDGIISGLMENRFDEIYTTSFIRLLNSYPNDKKWFAVLAHFENPSPLVRSAVVNAIGQIPAAETKAMLMQAARDPFLVVRRAAASSIAAFPQDAFSPDEKKTLEPLMEDYEKAFLARPDDWAAHYNLGNYYQNTRRLEEAIDAYEKSLKLYPEGIAALINQSFAYNLMGKKEVALERLYRALEIEPANEAANLNFAMLMGEMGRLEEAEKAMKKVLEVNPESAQAAYNLSVMLAERKPEEAMQFGKKAVELNPDDPKYQYSYAFYLNKDGKVKQATDILENMVEVHPDYADSWFLLGSIYEMDSSSGKAKALYERALKTELLEEDAKQAISQKLAEMK